MQHQKLLQIENLVEYHFVLIKRIIFIYFSRTQAKIEEETKGNRLIVFMIGGATQYEVRCLYELSLKYKVELIFGSTYFPSSSEFMQNILELNKPND